MRASFQFLDSVSSLTVVTVAQTTARPQLWQGLVPEFRFTFVVIRYQPKVMQHPAWYLTAPVSGSQVPLNSGPPCEVGSMADLQAYQNQLFLPAYVNSAYPSLPVANLQQNNAMPLLTYARHGGSSFDYAKPLAYVQPLPRALLGQPLPHMQTTHYEYPSACYPHFLRSHPYFVRRSSSASSQNNTGEMGPTASESGSSHINNHSSTGRGSCSFQPNVVLNTEKHRSRSSSNGSNQNSSPAVSVNNTVVSDSPLWLNDNSLLNSETVSNTADLDEPSMQSKEHEPSPLHQLDSTELLEDGKASK
ncbi:hypothetical protein FBUS_09196 [Fasciolopsis buskii]|uniref:Uncharacterized protein n=1 Tax=Fasciolopsis buskii TaxID=27845 RepID=A0A8E0RQ67_9TREM|nr:hypothetical protein FBUS_09196 [Fasciolopsis buski]